MERQNSQSNDRVRASGDYHLISVFFTKRYLTRSFSISEKAAEQNIAKKVSPIDMGASPGSPTVVTVVAATMLNIIAMSKVRLGLEFQKWPLSLTLNIRNMAE